MQGVVRKLVNPSFTLREYDAAQAVKRSHGIADKAHAKQAADILRSHAERALKLADDLDPQPPEVHAPRTVRIQVTEHGLVPHVVIERVIALDGNNHEIIGIPAHLGRLVVKVSE